MKPLPSSSTYAGWLAVIRILTGIMWLGHGIAKFRESQNFMPPNGYFAMYVSHGLQTSTGAYHWFLATVVSPNIAIFAELTRLGEVLTGLSLLLGLWTRLGGAGGVFLTLNYLAARGALLRPSSVETIDFAMLVLSLVSLVLPTGRVFGVDRLLKPKQPRGGMDAAFVPEPPLTGPTAPPGD
jgi:uncharacterized membrane protein YphA (DoxX/SURF4 family)